MTTLTSIDIGYSHTKAHANGKTIIFPSVVGKAQNIRYQNRGLKDDPDAGPDIQITLDDKSYFVGHKALAQSGKYQWSAHDRQRTKSITYQILMLAALGQLNLEGPVDLVTGLPVEWYDDRQQIIDQFTGKHQINGNEIIIKNILVLPQPWGSLCTMTLNDAGKIIAPSVANGTVGVIDIGGHTTDWIIADKFRYIEPGSGSAEIGMIDILETISADLDRDYHHKPDLAKIDHALATGYIKIRGQKVGLPDYAEPALDTAAETILGKIIQKWGPMEGDLDTIIITGGAAPTIGPYLTTRFPHAAIIPDSHVANVIGYYRYVRFRQAVEKSRKSKKQLNGAS